MSRGEARVGHIERSGSPRFTHVSLNLHFALATPRAHVPGRFAEPSNFKIGIALIGPSPQWAPHRSIEPTGEWPVTSKQRHLARK
jgi:hypothetical protein